MSHTPARCRTSTTRGNIPLLAVIFCSLSVLLTAIVLQIGTLVYQREQMDGVADAMASVWGQQMLQKPRQSWQVKGLPDTPVKQGTLVHDYTQDLFSPPYFDPTFFEGSLGTSHHDAWTPLFVRTDSTMGARHSGAMGWLTAPLPVLGTAVITLPLFTARGTARVKEVTLSRPVLWPERLELLLDFSRTMSLKFVTQGATIASRVDAYVVVQDAVTAILNDYAGLVNVGVEVFSDGVHGESRGMTTDGNMTKASDYQDQAGAVTQLVTQAVPMGNGTDFASALAAGKAAIQAAQAPGTSDVSAARVLLITDGEPSTNKGVSYSTNEDDNISQGRTATLDAMDAVWGAKNITPGGITSEVFFVQRQQSEVGDVIQGQSTLDFLTSLAGTNKNRGEPSAIHQAEGDELALQNWIEGGMTVQPRCFFPALDSFVPSPVTQQQALQLLMPVVSTTGGMNETIYAYYVPDAVGAPGVEVPARVIVNNIDLYVTEQQAWGAYWGTPVTAQDVPAGYLQENPRALLLHYDSGTRVVTVGGMLCAAMASPANADHHRRLRLRWGAPRPARNGCDGTQHSCKI